MEKILLMGFDPFNQEDINPSGEAVRCLHEQSIQGWKIEGVELPTVFKKSREVAIKYIKEKSPRAVICVGQAGGRPAINVERVAN